MKTYKLRIWGIVQGVGFRPFIYRLAKSLNLKGWVLNSTGSVQILIQGEEENIEKFMELIIKEAPPLSRIERIEGRSKFRRIRRF